MVQSLQSIGLRVVLDVVYNHTTSSGIWDKSVFDKLVPGYYHRYNEVSGEIERSTCCENTATEHVMMDKFVTDSLVILAREFGYDSFVVEIYRGTTNTSFTFHLASTTFTFSNIIFLQTLTEFTHTTTHNRSQSQDIIANFK